MTHDYSLNSFNQKKTDQPYDVSLELQLYVITIWYGAWTLPDSLFDHREILMSSIRLHLLRGTTLTDSSKPRS
jgi:hypothetical protein